MFNYSPQDGPHFQSVCIPPIVRWAMKLLAPSITRLCMALKHEVDEEILANTLAVMGVHANRLAHLKKQKITYKEEVHQLERAMTLHIQVFDGLFRCGAHAIGAQKRVKKELQRVTKGRCTEAELANLPANAIKCLTLVHELVECCKTSRNTMALLEMKYK